MNSIYKKLLPSGLAKYKRRLEQSEIYFTNYLNKFDFQDVKWSKLIKTGVPHKLINDVANSFDANLILLGAVGSSNSSSIKMGATCKSVINLSTASVITFKSEDAIQVQFDEEIVELNEHLRRGIELIAKGHANEALNQFNYCIETDVLFIAAYEGAAAAHARLGNTKSQKIMLERAGILKKNKWERKIETDVRKNFRP